jgi:hypothetical protein
MRADEEMTRARIPAAALAALWVLCGAVTAQAQAQPRPDPGEIHGLKLGLKAAEMKTDTFGDLACGSNGGPPRQLIDDWADFRKCRPEASGLHEVSARFDDQQDYVARAIDDPMYAQGKVGTRVAGHPVILSVLFDKDGVLRGIRMVSDARASPLERRMAHMLRLAIINRYEPDGWNCTDMPPAPGETPVGGGVFIKQRCEKPLPDKTLTVEARFLRKPGQAEVDPATQLATSGQFESWTRFEIMDPNYRKP